MTHRRFFASMLLLAASTAACDSMAALGPETASASDGLSFDLSADPRSNNNPGGDLFDRLAGEIRGFGGLYRNGQCSVSVVLVDLSESDHAIRVVKAALEPNRACATGIRVHSVQGQFTHLELQRYLGASRELLAIRGVKGSSVDYQQNRLVITVESREVAKEVIDALPRVGIPERAVVFQIAGNRPGRATPARPTPTRPRG